MARGSKFLIASTKRLAAVGFQFQAVGTVLHDEGSRERDGGETIAWQMSPIRETYTPGCTNNAVEFMARRTADSHAAFFLPHLRPGMRLLDCGCGPGGITVGLAQRVRPGEVTGVDMGGAQLERAREHASAAKVHVTFREASVYSLPFPDADFKFRRQYRCGIYFLDFYCTGVKLAVELDGGGHGFPDQRTKDERRNQFLAEQGINVLRFRNHQRRGELEAVRFEIWHALMQRTGRTEEIAGDLPKPAPLPNPLSEWGRGSQNAERTNIPTVPATDFLTPLGERIKVRGLPDDGRRDEEAPRRRLQTPLAAADQDGCRGEGEGGEDFQPVAADVEKNQTKP